MGIKGFDLIKFLKMIILVYKILANELPSKTGATLPKNKKPSNGADLMTQISPVNYKIHLEPDLKTFRFFGQVKITLVTDGKVDQACLNALDLAIGKCVLIRGGERISCSFSVNPTDRR